jgi:3-deoxy-D-manno-octulosonic-acid transferase
MYTLLIRLLQAAAWPLSWFNAKVRRMRLGWKESKNNLESLTIPTDRHVWWFHCASLGEFEQAVPVIKAVKASDARAFIAVTFFSPSGYEPRKNSSLADFVCYLPPDTPAARRLLIDKLNPHAVIWVKYDFWFGYLRSLKQEQIPLYLISSTFRNNHFLLRFPANILLPVLQQFTHIFTQDKNSADLLQRHGYSRVVHAGDTRFDRVAELQREPVQNALAEIFRGEDLLVIAGSSWPEEEKLLETYIRTHGMRGWKLLLVPHDISENHIKAILEKFAIHGIGKWSAFTPEQSELRILVVDSIGLLATLYRYAHIAIIGGGFKGGLHNMLEAAVHGMPILFGPETGKFWEASAGIEAGFAYTFSDAEGLSSTLGTLMSNEPLRLLCAEKSKSFCMEQAGATQRIMEIAAG